MFGLMCVIGHSSDITEVEKLIGEKKDFKIYFIESEKFRKYLLRIVKDYKPDDTVFAPNFDISKFSKSYLNFSFNPDKNRLLNKEDQEKVWTLYGKLRLYSKYSKDNKFIAIVFEGSTDPKDWREELWYRNLIEDEIGCYYDPNREDYYPGIWLPNYIHQ